MGEIMDNVEKSLIVIGIAGVSAIIYFASVQAEQDERLMAACMKDHKEYECVSMLRRHYSSDVIIMPSGR